MSQVLSQNEVDALLKSVMESEMEEFEEEENEAAESASSTSSKNVPSSKMEVQDYELTGQDRIARGKMPMLEVIHDKFCRDFRTILSIDLRKVVDVEVGEIKLLKFRDFLKLLPTPSCLSLFSMEPLAGNALMTFDSEFVFVLVDIFCGGLGKARYRVEGRDFTAIELGIVNSVVRRGLEELERSWKPIHQVSVKFTRTEINPQFISIAHPSEIVLLFKANIDVEGMTGGLTIVLPYSMIEPLKSKLSKGVIGERVEMERVWRANIRHSMLTAHVGVTGVFGNATLTVGELLNMKPGDILEIDAHEDDPIVLEVEGKEKFYARTGIHRGNKAVQIVGEIE